MGRMAEVVADVIGRHGSRYADLTSRVPTCLCWNVYGSPEQLQAHIAEEVVTSLHAQGIRDVTLVEQVQWRGVPDDKSTPTNRIYNRLAEHKRWVSEWVLVDG